MQPGSKAFDLFLGQVLPTPTAHRDVDFSNGYYRVPQALLTRRVYPEAGVRKMSGLAHTYLGAPFDSVSLAYIGRYIRPLIGPMVYDSYETALPALVRGVQIRGIVVDLPTAYRYRSRVADGMIVGQFPLRGKEHFAFVLEQGSPLRRCVNKALAQLSANGTLKKLQNRWLTPHGGGRVIIAARSSSSGSSEPAGSDAYRSVMIEESRSVDVTLEPLDEFVVVQPISDETETRAGLILPASATDATPCRTGIVTAVGDAVSGVEAGDKVLYPRDAGYDVRLGGIEVRVLLREELIARIHD